MRVVELMSVAVRPATFMLVTVFMPVLAGVVLFGVI